MCFAVFWSINECHACSNTGTELGLGLWLEPALFYALASSSSGTFYLLNASLNLSRYHHEVEQEVALRLSQDDGLILKLGLPYIVRLSERKEFATATSDTVKAWWSAGVLASYMSLAWFILSTWLSRISPIWRLVSLVVRLSLCPWWVPPCLVFFSCVRIET